MAVATIRLPGTEVISAGTLARALQSATGTVYPTNVDVVASPLMKDRSPPV